MTEENVSPNPSSPRRDDRLRRPLPERTSGSARLSDEAKAYLNAVVPRLDAERYEISWDEFDCIAKLSRFEWSKFGFVDYTFVFEEFDRLDARSLWDFSRTAFEYAARRGGWSLPGLQGAKICLPVALIAADEGAVDAVHNMSAPKHYAKLEFPCVYELRTGDLHYFQQTPLWGAFYYAGLRELATRMLDL